MENNNGDPNPQTKQWTYWPLELQTYCTYQLPIQSPRMQDQNSLHLASWKIKDTIQKPVWLHENIIAPPTTWWVLKDISEPRLPGGSRQLIFSLTWRKPMRQFGNMISSETLHFLYQNISRTGESESESAQHFLTNSTQRKVFQLMVSWLWHVLDWRLMSCPLVLPGTSEQHSLLMTWQSVFVGALGQHRDTFTAGSKCHTEVGDKGWS